MDQRTRSGAIKGSRSARRLGRLSAIAIAAALSPLLQSHAQNLFGDPNFANGVAPNGTQTDNGTFNSGGAAPYVFNGFTGISITNGYLQIEPIPGYATNGIDYVFTFFAASLNPQQPANFFAELGYSTCPDCSTIRPTLSGDLHQYTITATSSGPDGFVYFADSGSVFISGLDLEPAPAPLPGGGALGLVAVIGGLAAYRLRPQASR